MPGVVITERGSAAQAGSQLGRGLTWLRQFPVVPLGILFFVLIIPAIFAGQVAPHSPRTGEVRERLQPPVWVGDKVLNGVVIKEGSTWNHILGTDKIGRDMLSRIIHGARISLTVAVISIVTGALIGTTLGLIAGYFGGGWDNFIMRLVDIKLS